MIVPLKVELQRELQGWYDWANEKVMQATWKLQRELQEKEDIEKSKKEKQTVEEITVKRLAEMDYVLANAIGQIELANCTIRRLEAKNNMLRREMGRMLGWRLVVRQLNWMRLLRRSRR